MAGDSDSGFPPSDTVGGSEAMKLDMAASRRSLGFSSPYVEA